MLLSTAALADSLGITPRRIQQLADEGVFRREKHGQWTLRDCFGAYLDHRLKSEIRKTSTCGSAAEREKEMKAKLLALRLAREERELVPLADAVFAMDQVCGSVTLEMNNVPARFTQDLDERERLEGEVRDALTRVAGRLAQCSSALKTGRDPDPGSPDEG